MLLSTLVFAIFMLIMIVSKHKTLLNIKDVKDREYEESRLFDRLPAELVSERNVWFFIFKLVNNVLLFFIILLVITAGAKLAWIDRKAVSSDLRRISNKFKKDSPESDNSLSTDES
jgi:hypothetical protein